MSERNEFHTAGLMSQQAQRPGRPDKPTRPALDVITINIAGHVGTGKSAVMASIRDLLSALGYAVVHADPAERHNPSAPLASAVFHERPDTSKAVFILTETTD